MVDHKQFSQTYYDKANEDVAFQDYAPFRYGQVARDPDAISRIDALRKDLDPILVDIVDGGIEAAIMEAEAAVERTAPFDYYPRTARLSGLAQHARLSIGLARVLGRHRRPDSDEVSGRAYL